METHPAIPIDGKVLADISTGGHTIDGRHPAADGAVLDSLAGRAVLDRGFVVPPDGFAMVSRKTSGSVSTRVYTSSGQFTVQWWDGTITSHNPGEMAGKAVPGSGAWSGRSLKPVRVWPSLYGEALTGLECVHNLITAIDVSNLTALTRLRCADNLITALDVSNLTALAGLWCHFNLITALDVSNLTELTVLWCHTSRIESLRAVGVDLSGTSYINNNNLDAAALDQFYTDLAPTTSDIIDVRGNPGTTADDPTIATAKGYTIIGT